MKSPYSFVISPVGQRYNNKKKIGEKELILNSEVFNHEYVNRKGIVRSCPMLLDTPIEQGDEVIVHHNVFRRWHNIHGQEKNSKSFFNETTYIIQPDQIFLYITKGEWKCPDGFCWVMPVLSKDKLSTEVEQKQKGIIKYSDGSFEVNSVVGFLPNIEYEFIIDGQKLYRIYSKHITIKYEYQGNEEAYNPSWAQSS